MKIRRGDMVKVLYGKSSGTLARVESVNPKSKTVVIEGVNVFKRHKKGNPTFGTQSEIVDVTKPVPVAKIMYYCEDCKKPVRVTMKEENGMYVRSCNKCKKVLDTVKK